jgi:hypothetical protein
VFHVFHPDLWTVSYFGPQAVWISMPTPDLTKLNEYRDFARREGKTLWMEKSARDAIASIPSGPEWLALHEDRGAAIDRQILGVRFEFVAIRD